MHVSLETPGHVFPSGQHPLGKIKGTSASNQRSHRTFQCQPCRKFHRHLPRHLPGSWEEPPLSFWGPAGSRHDYLHIRVNRLTCTSHMSINIGQCVIFWHRWNIACYLFSYLEKSVSRRKKGRSFAIAIFLCFCKFRSCQGFLGSAASFFLLGSICQQLSAMPLTGLTRSAPERTVLQQCLYQDSHAKVGAVQWVCFFLHRFLTRVSFQKELFFKLWLFCLVFYTET